MSLSRFTKPNLCFLANERATNTTFSYIFLLFPLTAFFHSSFLNMVFIVGGVPELYEPACHFRCCKNPVAILLQPPRAKKLKSRSKKCRVIFSFMSKDTQSSSVRSFKSLRTLCSTPATEGRPSLQVYIGADPGQTRCFCPYLFRLLTFPLASYYFC